MSKFQERLKELKDASGKTQLAIATELGLTQQAFSYYMKGREPDFDVLIKIASYFGVSTDYVLGKSDVRNLEHQSAFDNLGLADTSQAFLLSINKGKNDLGAIYNFLLNAILSDARITDLLNAIIHYTYPDIGMAAAEERTRVLAQRLGVPDFVFDDKLVRETYKTVVQGEFIDIVDRSISRFKSEFITEN